MKKLFIILSAVAFTVSAAVAQNNAAEAGRTVKMPTESAKPLKDYGSASAGFWNAVELQGGYSVNHGHSNIGLTELDYVAGYRVNEFFRFGAGVGARFYPKSTDLRDTSWKWSFPIFVNVRGNIISREQYRTVVPYYSLDAGAAIRDGFMVRPTIGLRIGDFERSAFLVGISYLAQNVRIAKIDSDGRRSRDKYLSSFITLKIGYEF